MKKRISFENSMDDLEAEADENDKKRGNRFSFMDGLKSITEASGKMIKTMSDTFNLDDNEGEEERWIKTGPTKQEDSDSDSWASPRGETMKGPFHVPDDWPISAELAINMLDDERSNLKASESTVEKLKQNMLATNRFLAGNLRKVLGEDVKAFRGGIEPIAHVLPSDVQTELLFRVCSAAKNGEKEILLSLLRFSVDLDRSDMFGTPLHYAAASGQLQSIQILLDKGSYPGALNVRDETALHLAVAGNSPICAEILIQYGAPVNAVDCGGRAAIHTAAENGFVKVMEKLIFGGADCNKHTKLGFTPLHLATIGMHHELIQILCRDGAANPNLGCLRTITFGDRSDIKRAHVNAIKGETPAHMAAKKKVAEDTSMSSEKREETKEELNKIKSRLAKMLVRRNHETHMQLIEQTKKGIGGKKREVAADAAVAEGEDDAINDIEPDEQTLKEKLAAMALELEASKAETRALAQQSRMKTIRLNEAAIEIRRKLAEAEYTLAREQESRRALEQDILDTLTGGDGGEGGLSARSGGTYGSGDGYPQTPEVLRLSTALHSSSRARSGLDSDADRPSR